MFRAEKLSVVVIVLEANFGKLAGIKREVRRNARALASKYIIRIIGAFVAVDIFATQAGNPARLEPPEHLGIKAPIPQRLRWERGRCIGADFKPLLQGFPLPPHNSTP